MKTCPSCHKNYEDDSLTFCLHDGAALLQPTMLPSDPSATLQMPTANTTQPGPTVASPSPPGAGPPMQWAPPVVAQSMSRPEPAQRSALPWILGIVIVVGSFGVIIALILTRDRGAADPAIAHAPTTTATPTPSSQVTPQSTPTITEREETTPTPAARVSDQGPKRVDDRSLPGSKIVTRTPPEQKRPKSMFSVMNNISFDGSRITYYPRPSFGLCQADCAGNANCRGFTWIRPGAYNPGDSAMCYLMSAVTRRVSHPCCISAVRN